MLGHWRLNNPSVWVRHTYPRGLEEARLRTESAYGDLTDEREDGVPKIVMPSQTAERLAARLPKIWVRPISPFDIRVRSRTHSVIHWPEKLLNPTKPKSPERNGRPLRDLGSRPQTVGRSPVCGRGRHRNFRSGQSCERCHCRTHRRQPLPHRLFEAGWTRGGSVIGGLSTNGRLPQEDRAQNRSPSRIVRSSFQEARPPFFSPHLLWRPAPA